MDHKETEILTLDEFNESGFGGISTIDGDYILLGAYPSPGDLLFMTVLYSGKKEDVEAIRDLILQLESYIRGHRKPGCYNFPVKSCPVCYKLYQELRSKIGNKPPIRLTKDGWLWGPCGLEIRNVEKLFSKDVWCLVNTG